MAEQSFFDRVSTHATHVPDVLSCIANLSNDEVFTPPEVVNRMLDLLPQELFADPNTTFLDPATKTGVFLREIAKRCLGAQFPGYKECSLEIAEKKSLNIPLDEYDIAFQKQLQERIDHIFHKQLYAIGITELTSLLARRSVYCSKYPNGPYSITHFDNAEGNIRFRRTEHTWKNGKCVFCGASQGQYDRGNELETHAYEFIHFSKPEEIFQMKFDVIIGNPPYALDTDGAGKQAKPLYNIFIEQAKRLRPRYLSMIIPSRWFSGGMGLDSFRDNMINDNHITKLVDYTNAKDCFSGLSVSGGVCYFLWEKERESICEFTNIKNDDRNTMFRPLNEFPVLIRYNKAVAIVHKVQNYKEPKFENIISSLMPYGLSTSYRGCPQRKSENDLTLHSSNGISYISRSVITKGFDTVDKYKVLVSKTSAEHAGEPGKDGKFRIIPSSMKVLSPGEVCTHSYFVIGGYDKKLYADNVLSYLKTSFVRFLMLLCISGFGLSKIVFPFVPLQDFSKPWTDEELYAKYGLTDEEIDFIESMIKPMD